MGLVTEARQEEPWYTHLQEQAKALDLRNAVQQALRNTTVGIASRILAMHSERKESTQLTPLVLAIICVARSW
jgi:hypothetical protein